ncbi:MAG TPA: hypothetical protein VLR94_08575 [Acidobacteriota bacterium]|nr:hypothetical protein [Acidobacteriota bacterium]
MKVLAKDKIVETYRFPFSEALSFSILIWTIWGFVESFYWQRALPFFDGNAPRAHHFIFIAAFLIYVAVASIVAALVYSVAKWILFTMDRHETPKFRSATLCLILGIFFLAAIPYVYQYNLSTSAIPQPWLSVLIAVIVLIAVASMILIYRSAAHEGFRIRRSGTTMMSVLVLSALLSFVSFPLFSGSNESEPPSLDLKTSTYKLMVMHYIFDLPPQK